MNSCEYSTVSIQLRVFNTGNFANLKLSDDIMPATIESRIQFRGNDVATDATLFSLQFDQRELTKRALTRLGLCWLASIGSIPIIFAHWVLVPGFFIAGPVMAMTAYKMKTAPDHADGSCPACKEFISLKFEPKDSLPKWTYCPSCNHSIQVCTPTS